MLRLEAERFASRIPRRGLVVRSFTEQEVLDFFAVRVVLEGLAARQAAEHSTPIERVQLRSINQQMVDVVERGGDAQMMDALTQQFHEVLYQCDPQQPACRADEPAQ